jgi:protein FAM50
MGDFAAGFHRPTNTGIYTVEGNVAGARAAALTQQRIQDQQLYEQKRQQLLKQRNNSDNSSNSDNNTAVASTGNTSASATTSLVGQKFAEGAITSQQENQLQTATIGLVSADEFRKIQQEAANGTLGADKRTIEEMTLDQERATKLHEKALKKARLQRLKERKQQMATLSFAADTVDDNEADINSSILCSGKKRWIHKDPTVDTSFLPDQERDRQVALEREILQKEWETQQEMKKKASLEIVYSYWDGSGHRRTVTIQQGNTIGQFLEAVRKQLAPEFRELANVASDALLYIKEDLILNQDLTFYDLIATKARGKSGPLFHFDVHEDIRIGQNDVRIEKDESHPGKVVQRYWYERNKHIFPASRWEVYNPTKDYGSYTIGGKVVN